jgi:hypothetical protein
MIFNNPIKIGTDIAGRDFPAFSMFQAQQQSAAQEEARRQEEEKRRQDILSGLGFEQKRMQFGEFQAGAGQRAAERGLGEAQARIGLAGLGDIGQAGQRAYRMGREREDFERLKMAQEGQMLRSQMSSLPQMEAIRGGIMSRMAGRLGVALPPAGQSWMQSMNAPQFPRY